MGFSRILGSLPSHARGPDFGGGETARTGRGCKAPERSPRGSEGLRALYAEPGDTGRRTSVCASSTTTEPRAVATDPRGVISNHSLSPDPPRFPSKQEKTGLGIFFPNAGAHPSPQALRLSYLGHRRRTPGAAPCPVLVAEGTRQGKEVAAGKLPAFSSCLPFWRGRGGERQMLRERRRALPFPAAPTGVECWSQEGVKSLRYFVLLCRPEERSLGSWQPTGPKKGITKFRLGRNRGRRLCSCAHGERGWGWGGEGAGGSKGWGLRSGSHLPRRLFCFKAASAGAVGLWCKAWAGGFTPGRASQASARSGFPRDALGLVLEVGVQVSQQSPLPPGPPADSCIYFCQK